MEFHKKNLEFAKESGDNVLYCNSLMTLGDMVNKNIVALLEKEAGRKELDDNGISLPDAVPALRMLHEDMLCAENLHSALFEGDGTGLIVVSKPEDQVLLAARKRKLHAVEPAFCMHPSRLLLEQNNQIVKAGKVAHGRFSSLDDSLFDAFDGCPT